MNAGIMKWLKCSKINFSTDSDLRRVYIRVNERLNARIEFLVLLYCYFLLNEMKLIISNAKWILDKKSTVCS